MLDWTDLDVNNGMEYIPSLLPTSTQVKFKFVVYSQFTWLGDLLFDEFKSPLKFFKD
jgi:hypothetical protein